MYKNKLSQDIKKILFAAVVIKELEKINIFT